ncbi:MAG TPA: phosphoribosylglycinamide formyltransferase [Thermomicrobiales bacterium]|nr:phosphoribosylglycinamide formyltransferase [Thermomicrobiales bacterium]
MSVLLSGAGRTLENLLRVVARGELPIEIVSVISSVPDVRGLEVARDAGIPATTIVRKGHPSVASYSEAMYAALEPYAPDLILMAGFLRQMLVLPGWEGRILNIHPALLPEASSYAAGKGLFGERVHQAVLAHGDRVTGATVHLVTDDYDQGPPLLRVEVPVLEDDTSVTLGTRVFHAECDLYPEAIRRYMTANPHLRKSRSVSD